MKLIYTLPLLGVLCLLLACNQDDEFATGPDVMLEFSRDTLRFDTVFTQLGSATRILKLYNRNKQPILVDRISVESGNSTRFRFNIDGIPGNEIEALEIPAEDSVYIFGEVTVNPDEDLSASPFVISDALIFQTNGNTQSVPLEAWGQNANYFPSRFSNDSISAFTCNGNEVVWDDPKPYVIYGIVFFDDCDLVIPAGAQVYVHGGLGAVFDADGNRQFYNDGRLVIGPNASLRVEGTADNPVVFQGDRLEEAFDDVKGQWYGVILSPASTGNIIDHAVLKNSVVGIAVDSVASLEIKNSEISNTTANAIFARHAKVTATNCLFRDNSANSIRLLQGGDYDFTYCTMASFGTDASALSFSNVRCLDAFCQEFYDNDLNASFSNCIITGSQRDQINLINISDAVDFNYSFDHCIVRLEEVLEPDNYPNFLTDCNVCINNTDRESPLFIDIDDGDYRLDTLSIAEEMALPVADLSFDLVGTERDPNTPDIGCYEYTPE